MIILPVFFNGLPENNRYKMLVGPFLYVNGYAFSYVVFGAFSILLLLSVFLLSVAM